MSAAAMAGEGPRVGRELAFVGAIALTVFWLLPLVLLAMNAMKTPEEFLLTTGLEPPTSLPLSLRLSVDGSIWSMAANAPCSSPRSSMRYFTLPPTMESALRSRIGITAASVMRDILWRLVTTRRLSRRRPIGFAQRWVSSTSSID